MALDCRKGRRLASRRFARLLTSFVAVVLGTTATHAELYTLARTLETPGGNPYGFGYAVAAVRKNVLVGAYFDATGGTNAGATYLFDGDPASATFGALLHTFLHPDPHAFDECGRSVAAVGPNVLVGCEGHSETASSEGSVLLFDGDPASPTFGTLLHTFANPTPDDGDAFGWALAAVGRNALISSPGERGTPTGMGIVYLYDADPASPTFGALLHAFERPFPSASGYGFGWALAAVGNDALLGDAGASIAEACGFSSGFGSGAAYLFDADPASPAFGDLRHLLLPTPGYSKPCDYFSFGATVAEAAGGRALVGAPNSDAVYVFDAASGALLHLLLPKGAPGFGASLAAVGVNPLIASSDHAFLIDRTSEAIRQTFVDPSGPTPYVRYTTAVTAAGGAVVLASDKIYLFTTSCGDGHVDAGELCDDGNAIDGDGCDSVCAPTGCGNGVITAGEACDDGNVASDDGCGADCVRECGDGVVGANEQCDDGNTVDHDGCDPKCVFTDDGRVGFIDTIAGGGTECATSGDGGLATHTCLDAPSGVAVDAAGNVFLADEEAARVRRVDAATGTISTVAGNGSHCADLGDGGVATAACLAPGALALDAAGNLFLADVDHARVRRVDAATGVITTVAGNGSYDDCGDGGPATEACLRHAAGLAFDDAGNLFIADDYAGRVRRVDAATGIITAVAGKGAFCDPDAGLETGPATEVCLSQPRGLAFNRDGHLLVAQSGRSRIRSVDLDTGLIATLGGGPDCIVSSDGRSLAETCLVVPSSIAVDPAGDLLFDDLRGQIKRAVKGRGRVWTVAGMPVDFDVFDPPYRFCGDGGPAPDACLSAPVALTLDAGGNLFVADRANHRVRRILLTCGNASIDRYEACDDGNQTSADGCDANCAPTGCGNGLVAGDEACDDGNTADGDGCSGACTVEPGWHCTGARSSCAGTCGDGVVTRGEECDDGNLMSSDGCDANCTPTGCGNRVVTAGEACDDGNAALGDGCRPDCTLETCGDGELDRYEFCDDGNHVDGDGCAANCANGDGPLELRRVRIHRGSGGPTGTGSVFIRGELTLTPYEGAALDASVWVPFTSYVPAATNSYYYGWGKGDCVSSARGRVRCVSFDRREKLMIRPVRGKPGRFRLEITVNPRYEIVGAFAQEVRVDFVHFVPSTTDYDRYVIRSGTIAGCDVTANAVRCHAE